MTNFQGAASARVTREQVLLWTPMLLGVVLAAAAGGLLLWPALQQLQRDQQQLADLKEQEARVPLLRQELSKQRENLELAQQKERKILQLIAGSGDISTFMAQLGQEARSSGVQLDSYEPITIAAPLPEASKDNISNKPKQDKDSNVPLPPPPDPLLAHGLQKTSLLITARGSGPQLQDFLRRVERLSLLVVQSDLALKFEPPAAQPKGQAPTRGFTTLRLNMGLYSKLAPSASGSPDAAPNPGAAPSAKS